MTLNTLNRHLSCFIIILIVSCKSPSIEKNNKVLEVTKKDTSIRNTISKIDPPSIPETKESDDFKTYFVVVADTSLSYMFLQKKMYFLSQKLSIPIDTLGRYFNTKRNLIALPGDDEDEIYAGQYYPRRYPYENLSLEYLNSYQKKTREKTIALVSGIYETEKSADSAFFALKKVEKHAYKIKALIYIGCIH